MTIQHVEAALMQHSRGNPDAFWSIHFSQLTAKEDNGSLRHHPAEWLVLYWPVGTGRTDIAGKGATLQAAFESLGLEAVGTPTVDEQLVGAV